MLSSAAMLSILLSNFVSPNGVAPSVMMPPQPLLRASPCSAAPSMKGWSYTLPTSGGTAASVSGESITAFGPSNQLGRFADYLAANSITETQDDGAAPETGEADKRKTDEMNTLTTLRQRYTRPASQFVSLNDIPVHYVDEGGSEEEDLPVIVLVHGSFLDLTTYDPWIEAFKGYRVVRYDRLRWGLTGQGDGPTISYDDEEALLAALVDHLGLQRFVLAGSSSGGMTVAAYTAHNPERVEQLVLINFPLGHGRINNASKPKEKEPEPKSMTEMMQRLLTANFADPSLVTEEMVVRFGDLMDREDPTGSIRSSYAQAALFTEEERAKLLGEIVTPTLVMWSALNRTLPVENGRAAYKAVGAADKQFVIIEDAGHMLPLEKGALSGTVAKRFVDGEKLPESVGE